jgi:DNA-binding PadR family transcriptional regulator
VNVASRKLNNTLSLVVLGLLHEEPLHPYAMRTRLRERGHERTVSASGASLYDAVARLQRAGLIEVQSSSRAGRRPQRTTYRITPEGARELQAWVRAGLAELNGSEAFQAAIAFMYALPRREATELLDRRLAALDALIERADSALAEAATSVPEIFLSEERYGQHLRIAERKWVDSFTSRLRSGGLAWPTPRTQQR